MQTDCETEVNTTGSDAEEVALTVKVSPEYSFAESDPNVIVWVAVPIDTDITSLRVRKFESLERVTVTRQMPTEV